MWFGAFSTFAPLLLCTFMCGTRAFPEVGRHARGSKDDARHWGHPMLQEQNQPSDGLRDFKFDRDRFNEALASIPAADEYFKSVLFAFTPEIDEMMEGLFSEVSRHSNQPIRRSADDKCEAEPPTADVLRQQWRDFKVMARNQSQTCQLCTFAMNILKSIVCTVDHDVAVNAFVRLCEFVLERYNSRHGMCEGVITLQAPYVFMAWKESYPYDFCEHLNRCIPPNLNQTVSVAEKISKIISSVPSSKQRNSAAEAIPSSHQERSNLKIVQLTDVHISPRYHIGSAIDCNMYVCCLEGYGGEGSARMYGEHLCNIPERTMLHFLEKVAEINPDIIIFTGDAPPHIIWDETFESQLNCTRILVSALREKFPDKDIFPTFGNHEQFPTNVYATRVNYTMMMNKAFTMLWRDLSGFGPEQEATMEQMAYYSVKAGSHPGLRILALNNNHYWYTGNFMCTLNQNTTDEANYRQFIVDTLRAAQTNGEKVIVISHQPIGGSDHLVRVSRWWEGVAYEYSDVIIMHLSGHTHKDEFHLVFDPDTAEARYINMVATSVTANTNVNPSLKLFHLDDVSWEIVDIESFYMELDDQKPDKPPPIVQTYNAKELYGMDDLTPESWKELSVRFLEDDALFQTWYQNRDGKAMMNTCSGDCKAREVCRLWFPNYDEVEECTGIMTSLPPPTTPEAGGATCREMFALVLLMSVAMALLC